MQASITHRVGGNFSFFDQAYSCPSDARLWILLKTSLKPPRTSRWYFPGDISTNWAPMMPGGGSFWQSRWRGFESWPSLSRFLIQTPIPSDRRENHIASLPVSPLQPLDAIVLWYSRRVSGDFNWAYMTASISLYFSLGELYVWYRLFRQTGENPIGIRSLPFNPSIP